MSDISPDPLTRAIAAHLGIDVKRVTRVDYEAYPMELPRITVQWAVTHAELTTIMRSADE